MTADEPPVPPRTAIRIRTATSNDAPALADLINLVQQLHVAARPDFFKPVTRADLQTWVGEALASSGTRVLVADVGGVVAGYAVVIDGHRPDNAIAFERRWREVEQLGVHPDSHRRGIARALLEHIAATASADGIAALELSTWAFNTEAQAAFERLGFLVNSLRLERLSIAGDPPRSR